MNRLKAGDLVRVRLEGSTEWTPAAVVVASDGNPQSVGIALSGMVRMKDGGLVGCALPVFIDYDAETVHSLFGDFYEIEIAAKTA